MQERGTLLLLRNFALPLAVALLLSACAGSTDESSDSDPSPSLQSEDVAVTEEPEPAAETATPDEATEVETISDVIVLSYLPENAVLSLARDDVQGSGSCLIAVRSALDSAGNTVELSFGGDHPPMTARLEASPTNGDQVPCTIEARFEDVPGDATTYTAKQIGGTGSPGVYSETLTPEELERGGNQIVILEKDKDTSTVDAILDARCVKGKTTAFKIEKNYSEFSGSGRGDDIFVMNRVSLRNECDKVIRALEYYTSFEDIFGDTILTCSAKDTIKIRPGKSKKSPPDRGCVVRKSNEYFQNWETAKKSDITTSVVVTRVIFADGTSLEGV